jgi:hypothetical protein
MKLNLVALCIIGLLVVSLVALVVGGCSLSPAPGPGEIEALGVTHFSGPLDITDNGSASAPALYLEGDSDTGLYASAANNLDVAIAGSQIVSISASGMDVNGVVADDLRVTGQTTLTVTQGGTITATGTYQPLTAAGAVSTGSIAAGTAGDLLVLTNIGSNAIVISDTGTVMLNTDRTLGQYDTMVLLSDGTNWLELSYNDN